MALRSPGSGKMLPKVGYALLANDGELNQLLLGQAAAQGGQVDARRHASTATKEPGRMVVSVSFFMKGLLPQNEEHQTR